MTGKKTDKPGDNVDTSARRLNSFIQRIERLTEEKKALAADIREVFAEAKSTGFDPKIMRMAIKRRAMAKSDLEEQESLLDTYEQALASVLE